MSDYAQIHVISMVSNVYLDGDEYNVSLWVESGRAIVGLPDGSEMTTFVITTTGDLSGVCIQAAEQVRDEVLKLRRAIPLRGEA